MDIEITSTNTPINIEIDNFAGFNASDFNNMLSAKTTDDLAEGDDNLYFTDERVQSAMSGLYEAPLTFSTGLTRTGNTITNDITQYTDSDAVSAIKSDDDWNATDWDTAYGWGDHSGLYDDVGTASGLISTHESTYDHDLIATALQSENDPIFSDWESSTDYLVSGDNVSELTNDAGYLTEHQDLSGYVPYTGATGDLDLGTYKVTAKQFKTPSLANGEDALRVISGNTNPNIWNLVFEENEALFGWRLAYYGEGLGNDNRLELYSSNGKVYQITQDGNMNFLTHNLTTTGTITSSNLRTPKIYPSADSTTAVGIFKANGTTNVLNVDTTNGRVGIGTTAPSEKLEIDGNLKASGKFNTDSTATDSIKTAGGVSVAGDIIQNSISGKHVLAKVVSNNTATNLFTVTSEEGAFSGFIRAIGASEGKGVSAIYHVLSTYTSVVVTEISKLARSTETVTVSATGINNKTKTYSIIFTNFSGDIDCGIEIEGVTCSGDPLIFTNL